MSSNLSYGDKLEDVIILIKDQLWGYTQVNITIINKEKEKQQDYRKIYMGVSISFLNKKIISQTIVVKSDVDKCDVIRVDNHMLLWELQYKKN
uniref:Uncharacterized protein n=1 Tax=viral metagenome TaxID=1070528 RepID=A0A6C0CFT5_9ZZZZ